MCVHDSPKKRKKMALKSEMAAPKRKLKFGCVTNFNKD